MRLWRLRDAELRELGQALEAIPRRVAAKVRRGGKTVNRDLLKADLLASALDDLQRRWAKRAREAQREGARRRASKRAGPFADLLEDFDPEGLLATLDADDEAAFADLEDSTPNAPRKRPSKKREASPPSDEPVPGEPVSVLPPMSPRQWLAQAGLERRARQKEAKGA